MQCVVPSCTDKRHIAARQVRWSVLSLSPQLQISNRELVEKWVEFNELRAISFPQEAKLRGRDASYLAPPAQNRTCGFPAYGSHLGSNRQSNCRMRSGACDTLMRL